jgi:hypothetical protein
MPYAPSPSLRAAVLVAGAIASISVAARAEPDADIVPESSPDAPPDDPPPPAERPNNTVTLNPVRYALLHAQVEYERTTTNHTTLFVQPIAFHHATWYPFNHIENTTAEGIGADVGMRYFFFGWAPEGFYAGPMLSAYYAAEHRKGETLHGFVLSPGVQGGYDAIFFDWLVLGAGIGASYGFGMTSPPPGAPEGAGLPHSGLWVNFRSNVGIAF